MITVIFNSPSSIAFVNKIRLSWTENPTTTMCIGWDQISGNNPAVYYGSIDNGKDSGKYEFSQKPTRIVTDLEMNTHFCELVNLISNTAYYFVIKDSEGVSERYWFKTAPDKPEAFTCILGGDTKSHGAALNAGRYSNEMVSKLRPLFVMFCGDFTSGNATNPDDWKQWLTDWFELTRTDDGRLFPIVPVHGNHEGGLPGILNIIFNSPYQHKNPDDLYYSLSFGDNFFHVISLNTENKDLEKQTKWLKKDMAKSLDFTFKIAAYHKPFRPHTKHKRENVDLYNLWAFLFKDYGLDISLDADSHMSKITFPVVPDPNSKDEYFVRDDENGTIFLGEGSWGAGPRDNNDDKSWTLQSGSFNQFKWLQVFPKTENREAHIDIRTVITATRDNSNKSVSHVKNVEALSEENIFDIPKGIDLFSTKPYGTVITYPFKEFEMRDGDTLIVHAVSYETPSPEGWGAHYKEIVHFPDTDDQWAKIIMVQSLKCDSSTKADKYPCGEWDYIWNTSIMVPHSDTTEQFEIGSFVTPYGKRLEMGGEKGWQWTYDVTGYAPVLKGKREIITGNNQELLDLKFLFIKGTPVRNVLAVENIYPYGNYNYGKLADDSVLTERKIHLMPEAKAYRLMARISGHGHFGPRNCCEWDSKTHSYYINEWEHFRWNVWKDCGNNPIYPQGGTWPFDRAGWCPGTKVDEYEFELTPKVKPGDTITFDYGIEHYSDNGEKGGEFRMSHQLFSFGPPNFKNDAALIDIIAPSTKDRYSRVNPICSNPRIIIKNTGSNTLKSVKITYGLASGEMSNYQWQGELDFLKSEEIWLPVPDWTGLNENREFIVELSMPNSVVDENPLNNKLNSIVKLPVVLPNGFILHIKTNNLERARENSWFISDDMGKVIYSGEDLQDSTTYNVPINLDSGCYQFLLKDDMEDGISVHWWNRGDHPELIGIKGEVMILSEDDKQLYKFHHDFGQKLLLNFQVEKF
jgi:hypothetical protein